MSVQDVFVRCGDDALRKKLQDEGLPPLAARVLAARDISGRGDIVPPLAELPPPEFLPDIEKFCELLAAAVQKRQKICVVGDYDADGMCAAALATECLRGMSADVAWRIPKRMQHGYGLHSEIVRSAEARGAKLLITVDNGVSAHDAVVCAKSLGMTVCITDHHLPSDELPPADCIVNPHLGKNGEGKNLSGAGVAFYAMAALRRKLGAPFKMNRVLDLAALGGIADCMPMDKLNRTLIGGGLAHLRAARRPGPAALAMEAKIRPARISCRDISHTIAPRINAAGRFDRAELAVEALLTEDHRAAHKMALQMNTLNRKRKETVDDIMRQTAAMKPGPPAAVVYDKEWPHGVLGIVAGRLADLHQCPALVFSQWNGLWRGSGRAPDGWDLHALVSAAAQNCGDGAADFGGHKRAVGLSVGDVEQFSAAFTEECAKTAPDGARRWEVDELPPPEEVTPESVECLDTFVWGESFPRPLFAGDFSISEVRPLNNGTWKLKLTGGGWSLPAITFGREPKTEDVFAIFSLCKDHFTGRASAVVEEML